MSVTQGPTPVKGQCVATGEVIEFPSIASAAAEGFSQSCITRCIRGLSKSGIHAGFRWTTDAPLRPQSKSKHRDQVIALHKMGKPVLEISALLGCSTSTIDYHVRGLNSATA